MAAIPPSSRKHVCIVVEVGGTFTEGDWAGFRHDAITNGDVLSLAVVHGEKVNWTVPPTSDAQFAPQSPPVSRGVRAEAGVGHSVLNLVFSARSHVTSIGETIVHFYGSAMGRSDLGQAFTGEKEIFLRAHVAGLTVAPSAPLPKAKSIGTSLSEAPKIRRWANRPQRNKANRTTSGVIVLCLIGVLGVVAVQGFFGDGRAKAIQAGDCLSVRSGTLEKTTDLNLANLVVPCDGPTSHVRIIGIEEPTDPNSSCASDKACFWFGNSLVHYQFNAIPRVGDCFVGWRVTPTSDGSSADEPVRASASVLRLYDCETSPGWWLDPETKTIYAKSLETDESNIKPVRFVVETILTDAGAKCSSGAPLEWKVKFDASVEKKMCTNLK